MSTAEDRATPYAAGMNDGASDAASDGERTMIRTTRNRQPALPSRLGWVHYLVYTDDVGTLQRLRLGSEAVRIGRRAPCELVLRDSEVSGVHCEVQLRQDELVVSDRSSTNGTFVDGKRVFANERVPHGGVLQVGRQLIKHEFRDEQELVQSQELDRDLARASDYVQSLLPPPMRGGPVLSDWFFQPSTRVGGDGFGYHWLDSQHLVVYLLDVSGHGVGAAMHGVSVLGTLRQQTLPDTNFAEPAQVLARLNDVFPMDRHGGMFFTIWYGVLELPSRRLRFASAGQHPAYVVGAQGGVPQPLATRNLVIGAMPEAIFDADVAQLQPGDRLYLFSDGVFEIVTQDGQTWTLDEFLPLLGQPLPSGLGEPEHLFKVVRALARPGPLDDDFSILTLQVH
ncbi:MAG: SpoIIE family protein phosphatase [Rubrivivax sp.]|nr:SpoIIE family protein phosphatase [Rubrivivax sp.]